MAESRTKPSHHNSRRSPVIERGVGMELRLGEAKLPAKSGFGKLIVVSQNPVSEELDGALTLGS